MLYNYPKKLRKYNAVREKIKNLKDDEKLELNAYRSPSPMNELCEYINEWEKRKVMWNTSSVNTSALIVNSKYNLGDPVLRRYVKHEINEFAMEIQEQAKRETPIDGYVDSLIEKHKKTLHDRFYESSVLFAFTYDMDIIANYVISVSYSNGATNKTFAWAAYGDTILKNLRMNSPESKAAKIFEVNKDYPDAFEYLGKYYAIEEGGSGNGIPVGTD